MPPQTDSTEDMSIPEPFSKRVGLRIYRVLYRLSQVGLLSLLLLTLMGYFGGLHQYLDMVSHFRLQYLIIALPLFAVVVWRKRLPWLLIGGLILLINSIEILPWYFSRGNSPSETAKAVRLLLFNVNTANRHYDLFLEMIRREDPDIILLQEIDARWVTALRELQSSHPHTQIRQRSDNFGIGVFSRVPLSGSNILFLGDAEVPSILCEFNLEGRHFSILTTHALPPVSSNYFSQRNSQLKAISKKIIELGPPVILIGDLNVSLWSTYYQQLAKESRLVNARKGFGILPSWPTLLPFFQIPIDHCLVSPDIYVDDIRTLPHIGSDHLPLMVDLKL